MSLVSLDFVNTLQHKYNLFELLPLVVDRQQRMCLERVMGVLFSAEQVDNVLFGSIFSYCKWGITFEEYKKNSTPRRPIIKVWSGR
jgi:hypothetical protein